MRANCLDRYLARAVVLPNARLMSAGLRGRSEACGKATERLKGENADRPNGGGSVPLRGLEYSHVEPADDRGVGRTGQAVHYQVRYV